MPTPRREDSYGFSFQHRGMGTVIVKHRGKRLGLIKQLKGKFRFIPAGGEPGPAYDDPQELMEFLRKGTK